ncbi:MAG: NAD(P)/FAD-dependent oxidoreductase [Planctomycetota bacterium]
MVRATKVETYDALVVGGGSAGIGVAIALKDAGVERMAVLDRHRVGASFEAWPAETRLITPSFPTNSIGMLDLNSVAIGVSPGYSLETEHPTGRQYAAHLRGVAKHFELPVITETNVLRVTKIDDTFVVDTDEQTLRAKHVVWAAGEFQYPRTGGFVGSELCLHTANIERYDELEGESFVVIGGGESGIDAAYYLSLHGHEVTVLDKGEAWESKSSDPSLGPSTYSRVRMRQPRFQEHVAMVPWAGVSKVERVGDASEGEGFSVFTEDGRWFGTDVRPILAGGFAGGHRLVADLFERRDDGFPLLSDRDESTIVPGLFLCGPGVRHGDQVFCFIYKYRQRFAVVAKAIADSLGLPAERLELYRNWGMYLDDLSCCGEECVC